MPPRGGGHHAKAIKAKRRQQQEECKRKKEEEQQQQVDRYMTEYDKDGSGVLDKEEFTALLKAVFASYADAINGDVIDKLIKSCESQGGITKENISRVTRKYAAYLKEMAAAATARESIFNRFDTDGDGTISKQEMLPILKLCAKMIKGVPENEVRNARCAAAPRCCPCAQQSPPPSPIEPLRGKGYPWGWESPGRKRAFMPRPHLAPLTRRILPLFGKVDMGDVDAVFSAADSDHSGSIDTEEFKIALASWKESMADVDWVALEKLAKEEDVKAAAAKSSACSVL